jgi:tRNA A-37 threonylcarbamoyl transferase component Bud32/tetratricopeptide (TPR) repeat protein
MLSTEDRLAELLERWESALAAGLPVTPEELCRDDPEILKEFRSLLTKLGTVNAVLQATGPLHETAELAGPEDGGRYRVSCFHDRGGQAVIFAAEDTELRRTVALKWMADLSAVDPAERYRFVREAELMARLEHPGVVPVYGLCEDEEGRPYYAMRMIQGSNLGDVAKAFHARKKDMPPAERNLEFRRLLRHFSTVCTTIAYAHARGVIHRDIKPSNIRIGPFDETIVLDWGLAKELGAKKTESSESSAASASDGYHPEQTYPGTVMGSPAYMSPEQAAGDTENLGPPTDIYGLGATLYVILTGQAPFQGTTLAEVLDKVKRGDFPWPRSTSADVPKALEAVCLKAMALHPADRYADARSFAADIEQWLADEPVAAYREPFHVRARRWLSRHRTLATTAVVAALAVLTASAGFNFVLDKKNRELATARATEEAAKVRALEAQAVAEANYRQSREALDNIVNVVVRDSSLATNAALFPVREAVLRRAVENARGLFARAPNDREMRVDLAMLLTCLGEMEQFLGKSQEARRSLEESLTLLGEPTKSDSVDVRHARASAQLVLTQIFPFGDPAARKLASASRDELSSLVEQETSGKNFDRFGVRYSPPMLLAFSMVIAPESSDEQAKWRRSADERLAAAASKADLERRFEIETTRYQMWRQAAVAASRSNRAAGEVGSLVLSALEAGNRLVAIDPNKTDVQWGILDTKSMQATLAALSGESAKAREILTEVCDGQEKLIARFDTEAANLAAAWRSVGGDLPAGASPFGPANMAGFRMQLIDNLLRLSESFTTAADVKPVLDRAERQLAAIGDIARLDSEQALELVRLRLKTAGGYVLVDSSKDVAVRLALPAVEYLEPLAAKSTKDSQVDLLLAQGCLTLAKSATLSFVRDSRLKQVETLRRQIDAAKASHDTKILLMDIDRTLIAAAVEQVPLPIDEIQTRAREVRRLWSEVKAERPGVDLGFMVGQAEFHLVLATLAAAEPLLARTPPPKDELAKLCKPAIEALEFWQKQDGVFPAEGAEALRRLKAAAEGKRIEP